MINFTINDREVSGEDGWTILEVAREHGIDIPTLCQHGAVEPSGACRLCMVEVHDRRRSRVVGSCLYPIREGIKVATDTDPIKNRRRGSSKSWWTNIPARSACLLGPRLMTSLKVQKQRL